VRLESNTFFQKGIREIGSIAAFNLTPTLLRGDGSRPMNYAYIFVTLHIFQTWVCYGQPEPKEPPRIRAFQNGDSAVQPNFVVAQSQVSQPLQQPEFLPGADHPHETSHVEQRTSTDPLPQAHQETGLVDQQGTSQSIRTNFIFMSSPGGSQPSMAPSASAVSRVGAPMSAVPSTATTTAAGPSYAAGPIAGGANSLATTAGGGSSLAPTAGRGISLAPTAGGGSSLAPTAGGGSSLAPTAVGGSSLAPTAVGGSSLAPTAGGGSGLAPTAVGGSSLAPTAGAGSSLSSTAGGGSSVAKAPALAALAPAAPAVLNRQTESDILNPITNRTYNPRSTGMGAAVSDYSYISIVTLNLTI
jgi:hypothetical protein